MSAKQKLSPSRFCSRLFCCFILAIALLWIPSFSQADTLEDAARALARKAEVVPQRDGRFYLNWQNHSSVPEEQSEALRESFVEEIGKEKVATTQEADLRALRVSIEETPVRLILIASVPCTNGEEIRMTESPRTAPATAATSTTPLRMLKELLWQQQEPILAAVEPGDEPNRQSLLLLLNRENISLYHRVTDHWELQDAKPIHASDKPMRDLRGELRFSWGPDKQNTILLPGKTCDLEITEKIALNCRPGAQTWGEGTFIASPCNGSVWWLRGDSGDWSVPDRLLLRNPSLSKSAPSGAELELPGPLISISTTQAMRSDTAAVFNLLTGNYEVYRITLACGN